MGKRFGVGIIGAGNILANHAIAYSSLPELATLVAVADVDEGHLQSAKRHFKFKAAYKDYRDLLSNPDVAIVSICTPPVLHCQMILDSLKANKHVLCEKPMATSLRDADVVIRQADQHPELCLSFVYQYRTDPFHNRTRNLIQTQQLGKLIMANVRVYARRTNAYYIPGSGRGTWSTEGGGVLMNQAIHQLDSLVSFLGEPLEVSASMDTHSRPIDAEDTLAGWVRFKNGACATVECTVCAHLDSFVLEIIGENAQVGIEGSPARHSGEWSLYSASSATRHALIRSSLHDYPNPPQNPKRAQIVAEKILCKLSGRSWLPPRHWGHTPYVREFLQSITATRSFCVSAREARRSLELAIALYISGFTGESVKLPIAGDAPFYEGMAAIANFRSSSRSSLQTYVNQQLE